MTVHHEFDYLLGTNTDAIYREHTHDSPADVASLRKALAEDSRPDVRRNAIVALTAALRDDGMEDYVAALDDPDPWVVSEAAASIATAAPAYMGKPANEPALAALRAHAASIRLALASPIVTARFNAMEALEAIGDTETDIRPLLEDPDGFIRSEALRWAWRRPADAALVGELSKVALRDPNPDLRGRAARIIASRAAPVLATPVLEAVLDAGQIEGAGDVAHEIQGRGGDLCGLVPAIVRYLERFPSEWVWLEPLRTCRATCAARTVIKLLRSGDPDFYPPITWLRDLSGHPEWDEATLRRWANEQPACPGTAASSPTKQR